MGSVARASPRPATRRSHAPQPMKVGMNARRKALWAAQASNVARQTSAKGHASAPAAAILVARIATTPTATPGLVADGALVHVAPRIRRGHFGFQRAASDASAAAVTGDLGL